ncbi:RidA family protein [Streptomyces violaceusniger]|uniref:RidA family protein n=1 Tax=Streptomyces violaceusniger TaxID=68280 RepID=UPI00341A157C
MATPNEMASTPSGYVTPVVVHQGVAYVSGQLPRKDGRIAYHGKVGADVDVESARAAARLCAQACLTTLDSELSGEGGRVLRILKITGFVASAPDFTAQGKVIDAASEVLIEALGDSGRHARSAVGVAQLPHGACVEIEVVAALGTPS